MNSASLLVLSRYPDIFAPFRDSMDILIPDIDKILIRSGDDIRVPANSRWMLVQGRDPFNFSRNVNLGFSIAGRDDVVLCGDDVKLTTPNFVSILQSVAYSSLDIAVAVPELGGQSIFVCGYIKREVIDNIGGLDERFDGYGMDDVDFYTRYEAAGYCTQPTTRVQAEHNGGTSFWRREREEGISVQESNDRMRELFKLKWGKL